MPTNLVYDFYSRAGITLPALIDDKNGQAELVRYMIVINTMRTSWWGLVYSFCKVEARADWFIMRANARYQLQDFLDAMRRS